MNKTANAIAVALLGLVCAPAGAGEVMLGMIASTSVLSSRGNATSHNLGYRVYFDELNKRGGVNGNTVKVVLKDDGLKVENMIALTREFIADPKVVGLVGYLGTPGLTEMVKQNLLVDAGIAMVSPQQGDKRLVSAPNFFPFRSGYLDEVSALVKEIKQTQKQRLFIVHQSTTLGPPNAAFAEEEAKRLGVPLVGKASFEPVPDKMPAALKLIVDQVVKTKPDAILLISAGAPAFVVIAALRDSPADPNVIYGMSITQVSDAPASVPIIKAHGVVLAQSVPYPFSGTLPIVREYQKAMKEIAPDKGFDYLSLEGFIGAKICHAALKRAGKKPTRASFLAALKHLGEVDLGGVSVKYNDSTRQGWGGVDLTIIDRTGRLQH
jgi:ABC-type branched-subunit amino acid transport system substrate-binding protein